MPLGRQMTQELGRTDIHSTHISQWESPQNICRQGLLKSNSPNIPDCGFGAASWVWVTPAPCVSRLSLHQTEKEKKSCHSTLPLHLSSPSTSPFYHLSNPCLGKYIDCIASAAHGGGRAFPAHSYYLGDLSKSQVDPEMVILSPPLQFHDFILPGSPLRAWH